MDEDTDKQTCSQPGFAGKYSFRDCAVNTKERVLERMALGWALKAKKGKEPSRGTELEGCGGGKKGQVVQGDQIAGRGRIDEYGNAQSGDGWQKTSNAMQKI